HISVAVENGEGFAVLEVSRGATLERCFDFDFVLGRIGGPDIFDQRGNRFHQVCTAGRETLDCPTLAAGNFELGSTSAFETRAVTAPSRGAANRCAPSSALYVAI